MNTKFCTDWMCLWCSKSFEIKFWCIWSPLIKHTLGFWTTYYAEKNICQFFFRSVFTIRIYFFFWQTKNDIDMTSGNVQLPPWANLYTPQLVKGGQLRKKNSKYFLILHWDIFFSKLIGTSRFTLLEGKEGFLYFLLNLQ